MQLKEQAKPGIARQHWCHIQPLSLLTNDKTIPLQIRNNLEQGSPTGAVDGLHFVIGGQAHAWSQIAGKHLALQIASQSLSRAFPRGNGHGTQGFLLVIIVLYQNRIIIY